MTAYRRRLTEIGGDIEHARALRDTTREEQVDAERQFLLREWSRAIGLGGPDRRAASATERARAAVTRAIAAPWLESVNTIRSSRASNGRSR